MSGGDADEEKNGKNSAHSFGTGSFTTNTFNARLAGSHGMQILKYIQSEHFGKHGESIKLIANINVSFTPLCSPECLNLLYSQTFFIDTGIHEQARS